MKMWHPHPHAQFYNVIIPQQ